MADFSDIVCGQELKAVVGRELRTGRLRHKAWRVLLFLSLGCLGLGAPAQGTQPVVAIHDSELTRALETQPASGLTPGGPGTTGFQWWLTQWHYFVIPDALKEALRSDGTAFTVVGDSNILSGALTNSDGSPKYPILISLGAEAIHNNEIAQLTNYVAAGGFLFVGSSSFTRNTNGTSRSDFAIANALGLHMLNPALTNWSLDNNFSKITNHRLVQDLPGGTVAWQLPSSSEEISWPVGIHLAGETPNAQAPGLPHLLWQVQATDAQVIAQGDGNLPYLLIKPYGKGYFIYIAALQPLLGHGGWSPGMYAYSIFRRAIEWAFASAGVPVVKSSPWPYPYDAAVIFRHDMEAIPALISSIEGSAQFERTNGAYGDYYFCTGTLRLDMPNPTLSNTVASLQRAMNNYGATIGPHNGGLTNINNVYNPSLVLIEPNLEELLTNGWLTVFNPYTSGAPLAPPLNENGTDYDYWHWSPDEILDLTNNLPSGFANGRDYAFTSISNSFNDIAGWGLTNGTPKSWVAPYFNATREASYQLQDQLGIKITGDDKLTPFPHWIFSTQTPDKNYSTLSIPVSDWFVGTQVAQSMENGHTSSTIHALVDFYYNLGALINLYCHSTSDGAGMDGPLPGDYVTYSLAKPRVWSTNSAGIYAWWLQRSNAQVTTTFTNIGNQSVTTLSIQGENDPNAAVELSAPSDTFVSLQVLTNGVAADTSVYRTNGAVIKIKVGTSVTNVVVTYILLPTAQDDFYLTQGTGPLTVAAPGVLTNDVAGTGGGSLTAGRISGPANGNLTFNSDGSFAYTPTNGYTGMDGFTYQAINGSLTSSVATAAIMTTVPGQYFYDNFFRLAGGSIFPWVQQSGTWGVTNQQLVGTSTFSSYGYAYYNNTNWTDYSVQAQIRFSTNGGWGGGLGGRLDPMSGARYDVWIYPENSPVSLTNGAAVLELVKYQDWTTYNAISTPIALSGVGTGPHTVKLTFQGTSISAFFDGGLVTNVVDDGTLDDQPAYLNGGISLNMWTQPPINYTMTVDDVIVSTPIVAANNDSYLAPSNATLEVSAPGVLANDSGGVGTLTTMLVSGTSHGTLTLTNNGGFRYTPNDNYTGLDSFTYRATDGQTTSTVAAVTITVVSFPVANDDSYSVVRDTTLRVSNPGLLANDTGGSGPLNAMLVAGPANGTLTLTNSGGLAYTPSAGYVGSDSFTYRAFDGFSTSAVATVTITVFPPPTSANDFYTTGSGAQLNVAAPGVLTNDSGGNGALSSVLVAGPASGNLSLNGNGSFTYQPTSNYSGIDSFTYVATDGLNTSGVATVAVDVLPDNLLFFDNFNRSSLWPWVQQSGAWSIANNALSGTSTANSYGFAYLSNNWTDYIVQGQIQVSSANAWGGGLGGRLSNPINGQHYAAWVYPESSPGGPGGGTAVLKLFKFHSWNDFQYTLLAQTTLTNGVGTAWHTLALAFQSSNIVVYFDGNQVTHATDDGSDGQAPYLSGGITADMWTDPSAAYTLSLSNVSVTTIAAINDSYSMVQNSTLTISDPGVLANDIGNGATLNTVLASGPSDGSLLLSDNGGFIYTPAPGFTGQDHFNYRVTDGQTTSTVATATITVHEIPQANDDSYRMIENTSLTIGQPGVLANDTGGSAPLKAIINSGPANGTLNLSTNGGFVYIPTPGFVGTDAFTYRAADSFATSAIATASISVYPPLTAGNDLYNGRQGVLLTVAAPGVLSNDTGGTNNLVAVLASGPQFGDLNLNSDGSFSYQPTNNYAGIDSFTYVATDGSTTSGVATVALDIVPAGGLFLDNFNRSSLWPWVQQSGSWNIANNVLNGTNPPSSYGHAYVSNNWTDCLVQGRIQFSSVSAWGGGIGGRLVDPVNGQHYAAWVYPESSPGGPGGGLAVLKLFKFHSWNDFSYTVLAQVTLTNGVGTDWHTLGLAFQGSNIFAYFDGNQVTNATDNGSDGQAAYTSGGITADMWTDPSAAYTLSLSNVSVTTIAANNDSYSVVQNTTLTAPAPGVLANDTGSGGSVTAVTNSGPTHGSLSLSANGGFTYTPDPGFAGMDSFTYSAQDGAYNLGTATVTITVIPVLTVTANNQSQTYGATNPPLTVSYSGFVNGDDTNILSGAPNVTITATTNSPVGSYAITITQGSLVASNYILNFVNGTLSVTPAPLTVTAQNAGKVYGQTLTFAGTEFTTSGLVNGDTVNGVSLSSSGAAVAAIAGTYDIIPGNAAGTGLANYSISYVNGTLTVNPTILTVSADNKSRVYGTTNPVFTASYSGFVNGENAGVLSGTPALSTTADTNSPVGTYPITVSQGTLSNANYSFSFTNGTLTVTVAALTVTANNQSRTYGATNPVLTVSYSGFVNGDGTNILSGAPSVTTTATTNSPVGSYAITVTQGSLVAFNYSFNFIDGSLSVTPAALTVSADNQSRVYGQSNPSLTGSLSGVQNNDNITATNTTATTTASPVGSYAIVPVLIDPDNQLGNYTVVTNNGTLSVTPAALTVTAQNASKVYGQTLTFAGTEFTTSGLVNGDTVNGVSLSSSGTAAAAIAGTYDIIPGNAAGTGLANYSISYVNGTLTVNPTILTVSADNKSRVYGTTNPVFTASYSGFVNGENAGVLSGTPALSTTADTNSPVGTYPITVSQGTLSNANYSFSFTNGTLTVTVAALTVTANNQSRTYGATNPVLTVSYSGFVNGDGTNILSGAPSVTTTATTNSPVGSYAITVTQGSLAAFNYSLNFVNGSLSVTPAALTVSADNQSRVYGQSNPSLTGSLSGVQNNDNITATNTTATTTASPVGSYAIVPVLIDPDNQLGNYTVVTNNGTLSVTPAPLTVIAESASKVYGQTLTFAGTEFTTRGLVNGDTVDSVSLSSSGAAAAATVSAYAIIPGNASGTGLANYSINYFNGTLSVTPAALTVTAQNASKVYGQTLTFAGTEFTTSGLVNGDTVNGVSLSSSGAAVAAIAGTYDIIPGNAAGTGLANYSISYVNGTLTVNPTILTVSADNKSRVYGTTNPVFTASYSGFVNGENAGVLSGTPHFSTTARTNSHVGTYPITVSQGTLSNANYSFSFTNGTLTVTVAALTVTANNQSRTYGATNPVLTVSYSGFVNGDGTNILSGAPSVTTTATTDSPVGSYAITVAQGSLAAFNYSLNFIDGSLSVTPAALTVTAQNASKVYGQTLTFAGTEFTTTGLVNGDTVNIVSLSSTGAAAAATVSTYAIIPGNASGTGLANYSISYVNGTLSVTPAALTVTAQNASKVYGQTLTFAGTEFTTSGLVNGDTVNSVSLSSSGAAAAATVSAYAIIPGNAAGTGLANYSINYVNGTLSVTPVALTVTAQNAGKVYGQTLTFAGTEFTTSGLVNGDTVNGVSLSSSGAAAAAIAGTYDIIPGNAAGTGLANYSISYFNGTLTVNPTILTVSADNKSRVYGTTNPVFTASYSGFVNGENAGVLSGTPHFSTTARTNSHVGTYPITVSQGTLSNANYSFSFTNGTLTVTVAALTVTANNQSRTYGATNPVLTVSYSGFVNGDGTNTLSGAPSVTTTATTNSPVGSYTITVAQGSLAAFNYSLNFIDGSLSVTPAALTVSADNQSRVYGQSNPSLTGSLSGVQNNDNITATNTTAATTASPVGSYAIVPVLIDPDNQLGNYTVVTNNGTLSVTPAPLTVTAQNAGKVYGQTLTFAGTEFTTSGLVNGDTVNGVSLSSSGAAVAAIAGTYDIIPGNAAGTGLANYSISYVNGTLTVTAAPVPAITSLSLNSGVANITWSSVAGLTYRVQYRNDLAIGGWTDLSPDVTATNSTASQIDVVGTVPQRFYRVALLPPGF